jgi:homopolymeric O-antigen transport system ATP-binding protein
MSDVAIKVEGLSKQYRIGQRERYKALRDVITDAAASPFRRLRSAFGNGTSHNGSGTQVASLITQDSNHIWALDDVSFEVKRGEVVGIIGRNGAGKSTLLKILSRITKPTRGHATIHGRVGSLLEVGTGFHPELTGRENIYLNAAILGMRKAEVGRKFDEIVAFAGLEKFIDTPVKRYSSGMYVRLAFAVAAHMETEILLVDEVLAVGDAQFQKKCFDKMREIGKGGRTILFVSHNMSAMRSICELGLELEAGLICTRGEINSVVDSYLSRTAHSSSNQITSETPSFLVRQVSIDSLNGKVIKTFDHVEIKVTFTPKIDIKDPGVYVSISTSENVRLAGLDFKDFRSIPSLPAGQSAEMGFVLDSLPLLPGSYELEVHLKDMATHRVEIVPTAYAFDVAETQVYGGRKLDRWFGHIGLRAQAVAHSFGSDEITTASDYMPVNIG